MEAAEADKGEGVDMGAAEADKGAAAASRHPVRASQQIGLTSFKVSDFK